MPQEVQDCTRLNYEHLLLTTVAWAVVLNITGTPVAFKINCSNSGCSEGRRYQLAEGFWPGVPGPAREWSLIMLSHDRLRSAFKWMDLNLENGLTRCRSIWT
jgi:hypothetical protein